MHADKDLSIIMVIFNILLVLLYLGISGVVTKRVASNVLCCKFTQGFNQTHGDFFYLGPDRIMSV